MLKILDKYILKRYLGTFSVMLLLFIPIGIMVDLSSKIDNLLLNNAPLDKIIYFYFNFTIYIGYILFPLFLFLSVIWFTSKLANKTEIVAILSSGISFSRFLRPYLIGAAFVAISFFLIGMYVLPNSSKEYNEFKYEYINPDRKTRETTNVFRQLSDNDYLYASSFDSKNKQAYNFTLEHFEDNVLKYKIEATKIKFQEKDTSYRLTNYIRRNIGEFHDEIIRKTRKDTVFDFDLDDLAPVNYIAETLSNSELNTFIEKEKQRGSSYVSRYEVVKYKRWSIPVSAFILTVIAVAVSAMKRRGGMGVNLAFGIALAFIFIFIDRMFSVMADQSGFNPLLAVWLPNIIFGILAIILLNNAKR
ncbi:MAG: LptF/LptG family permease [Flavobacteriaceae bacterium]